MRYSSHNLTHSNFKFSVLLTWAQSAYKVQWPHHIVIFQLPVNNNINVAAMKTSDVGVTTMPFIGLTSCVKQNMCNDIQGDY
jgi:hypothetical protein